MQGISSYAYLESTLPTIKLPATTPIRAIILGIACERPNAALRIVPLLVLPPWFANAWCPFDVAKIAGSTVAVLASCVCNDVENVCVTPLSDSLKAESLRKTSAKEGAGTLIWQAPLLHVMVWISLSPINLPSEAKWPPNV